MSGPYREWHRVADHKKVAAAARQQPGQWQPVGEYPDAEIARATASQIRRALLTSYGPAEAFQTWRSFETGRFLWVRYVEGIEPSHDVPEPMSDPVRLVVTAAYGKPRMTHVTQAEALLAQHGYADEAAVIRQFIDDRDGRKSALQAAVYLHRHVETGRATNTTTGDTK